MQKHIKNQKGGSLLITMVSLSMMILLLMSAATLKLAEVSRHAARANEQLRFINAMDDLAQTLARARVLGAGTPAPLCPAGSAEATEAGLRFCVPNSGSGGGTGLTGICADLDQNAATTHDRYCVESLVAPTSVVELRQMESDLMRLHAEQREPVGKMAQWFRHIFMIASSYASCSWNGCGSVSGSGATGTTHSVQSIAVPGDPALPAGAASEITPSATAGNRNNMESWSPTLSSWSPNNEMYIPSCAADDQYWWGCMRCTYPGVSCVKMTICPANKRPCGAAERYEQLIAIW